MTPPKARNRENKGLPKGWRLRRGLYLYRVPVAIREHWDNKSEFRLGTSLAEAHRTFSGRIAAIEGAVSADNEYPTMGHLLDHYLLTITPTKAPTTQAAERNTIAILRAIWGESIPADITPQQINKVKHATALKRGARSANAHLATLSHVFTMGIEWGAMAEHPMTNKKVTRVKQERTVRRIPTDEELVSAISVATPILEAYVEIKIRTGLRQTDMLKIRRDQIKPDGLHVTISKTARSTGKSIIIEMDSGLRHWINKALSANRHNVQSMWLFQTKSGESYMNEYDRADGFKSLWARWMKRVKKLEIEPFPERYLRNKVGDDSASDEAARELLGHDSVTTTRKFYRNKPAKVTPIKRGK